MIKYLLDTNICIHFLRGKFNLIDSFNRVGLNNCGISEITYAELIYGAENSLNPAKNNQLIDVLSEQLTIPPIFSAIPLYGKEKAKLRKKGTMVSDFDLLIGCTSIKNSLIMVTENTKDFSRIDGISIENWVVRNP